MNEELTKLISILVVFTIGMVSAGAVITGMNNGDDIDGGEGKTIYIDPEPVNQPPVASLHTSAVVTHPFEEITIDASASVDPDGTILEYLYDFGDGSAVLTTHQSVVIHTYRNTGEYTLILSVRDNNDTLSTNTMHIDILVVEEVPQEVITTSSRSIDDFDVAFETVETSPLAVPPVEEEVEEDQAVAPELEIPELPYETGANDPAYPDLDSFTLEEPDIDLGFDDLENENAGYDAVEDWEGAEQELLLAFTENQDADAGALEKNTVDDFISTFGTFEQRQDTDDSGKNFSYRAITVVNVTVSDTDEDGNPESTHTQTMAYEAFGEEENPTYESLYSSEIRMFDNNSDGVHNYLRINQFGFESVDHNGDSNPEYSLISIRVIVVYDNNSDSNPEYAQAFEVTFVRVDGDDDGNAEFQAAHFARLEIWDENSDGNFRLFSATEWNSRSRDRDNDTISELATMSGMRLVMFDNSSDGTPNYAQYTRFGIASRDLDDDGVPGLMITVFERWTVRDNRNGNNETGVSDGNPELIMGTRAYLKHNGNQNSTVASFENLVLHDNSSDGVHNHIRYGKVAWVSRDNDNDGNQEFAAVKFEDFLVYKNDTAIDQPSYVRIWRVTAVQWDTDDDGEANAKYFKAEGYIMQDEDQDGTPEVQWHVVYEGDGEEEEP